MDRDKLKESLEGEVKFTFSRSGGPGGQNVNKVNTKVTAVVSLEVLEGLSSEEKARVLSKLSGRINSRGELFIQVEDERSQMKNRALAVERLFSLICAAVRIPKKRRPTKPGRAAREKRLNAKRKQKEKKESRRAPRNYGD
ncbi:MAG: alternative ribosome rescue aminoacyl-tRNA hydrolase ArfB [Spirochaetales bacterium]|nr:alternative ribosome rescue aminoacyl-tRNA hydrolase ArfB [Spirochaetales bacterium]